MCASKMQSDVLGIVFFLSSRRSQMQQLLLPQKVHLSMLRIHWAPRNFTQLVGSRISVKVFTLWHTCLKCILSSNQVLLTKFTQCGIISAKDQHGVLWNEMIIRPLRTRLWNKDGELTWTQGVPVKTLVLPSGIKLLWRSLLTTAEAGREHTGENIEINIWYQVPEVVLICSNNEITPGRAAAIGVTAD